VAQRYGALLGPEVPMRAPRHRRNSTPCRPSTPMDVDGEGADAEVG